MTIFPGFKPLHIPVLNYNMRNLGNENEPTLLLDRDPVLAE